MLLIHIILFCYWLGGDIGVFYSSNFVVDLIPKICMSLMLTVGGILTHYNGIDHPLWQWIGILILGPIWLTMVLIQHFKHQASFIPTLTKIDFYFRCLMVAGIVLSCLFSLSTGRLDEIPWVTAKLLGFAFLIFCGLMIRVNLKNFSSSYVKIAQNNYNDADNQAMALSLKSVKPWVVTIWVVLVIEAALGIVKPVI